MDSSQFARWMNDGAQNAISKEEVRLTLGCSSENSSVTIKKLAEKWLMTTDELKLALRRKNENDTVKLQEFVDFLNKKVGSSTPSNRSSENK
ncbi:uncharacterized protein LOC111051142 isoform X2 [Nilaparvata lugens]|uniref:uncharacterized protein LOC111051142 isoform X1 n=1 Tax=Nilaparvata lugens TaxID=108931 RepID=UPI00193DAC8C|nr:uncharacterized protein LOC111051142 isoform X1 [Nilaparvata lugens]XP_039291917.1 uncharacterized protein LOC111051142 isoform X2 [Nilaparvata lugens]